MTNETAKGWDAILYLVALGMTIYCGVQVFLSEGVEDVLRWGLLALILNPVSPIRRVKLVK